EKSDETLEHIALLLYCSRDCLSYMLTIVVRLLANKNDKKRKRVSDSDSNSVLIPAPIADVPIPSENMVCF
ncbi:hypothetical protein A2U01_0042841, partial [Trifolium medium]|nr:hypothetical protein [Trifolium medium]